MEISTDENIRDSIINNIDTDTLIYIAKGFTTFDVFTIENTFKSMSKKQTKERNELSMMIFGMEYKKLLILIRIMFGCRPDQAKEIIKGAEKIQSIHKSLVNRLENNTRKRKKIIPEEEEEEDEELLLAKNDEPLKRIDLTLNADGSDKDEEASENGKDKEPHSDEETESEVQEECQPVRKKRTLPDRKAKPITCRRKRRSSQRALTPVDIEQMYNRWKLVDERRDKFELQTKPEYVSIYALYSPFIRMLYKDLRKIEKRGDLTANIMKEKIDEISERVVNASQKGKEMNWENFLDVMLHDLRNASDFTGKECEYDYIRDYFIDVLIGKYPHDIQPIPADFDPVV